MVKKLSKHHSKKEKGDYVVNSLAYNSENNCITVRELIPCSECGKDNIISLNLNAESFKNINEEIKKEDLDKIFKALAHVPPPKS
jgi:hypothetical protein